jgi:hypothetical protein
MSYERILKINLTVTWFARVTVIALASTCVYFLQDIHSDFKAMRKDVEDAKIQIATSKTDISNIKSILHLKD